ncbi:MAG: histidinol dehydrogenase [Verrucomicrobiota bacterium]
MQKIPIIRWNSNSRSKIIGRLVNRDAVNRRAEEAAERILKDVQSRGDPAVCEYAAKFDGVVLEPGQLELPGEQLNDCAGRTGRDFREAARAAHKRIREFSSAGMRADWSIKGGCGELMGEKMTPFDRVGIYVPGGTAPLASTALMTVTLARVAGVREIVVCTPCDSAGRVDPHILYALKISGATEIYRVGGVQAIGMLAYGTKSVRKVQKIAGPGNAYVTAAKRQAYGHVALDLVAGPSEIAILADDTASASDIAADLLSQAEHGTGEEKALLVTDSEDMAYAVRSELAKQSATLARRGPVGKVMKNGMALAIVKDLEAGMELCNRFAPEHFEIQVKNPSRWLKRVAAAGAVFLGRWTPETVGDFIAGPSHVLPTGGAASSFSGLTVDDFRRRTSFVKYTRKALKEAMPHIEAFARVEGLDAHGRSAGIRFERQPGH